MERALLEQRPGAENLLRILDRHRIDMPSDKEPVASSNLL
jgi:hypothetical protein